MRKSDKNRNSFKLFHTTSTLNLPRYSISDINNKHVKDGEFFYLVSLIKQEIIKQKNLEVIGWEEAKWEEIYKASTIPFTNEYDHKLSTSTLDYLLENKELFPSKFKSKKVIFTRDRKRKLRFNRESQFIDLEEFENDLILMVEGKNVRPEIEPRFIQTGAFYNKRDEIYLNHSIQINKNTINAFVDTLGKQKSRILQLGFSGLTIPEIKATLEKNGMKRKNITNLVSSLNGKLNQKFNSNGHDFSYFCETYRVLLDKEELTRYLT